MRTLALVAGVLKAVLIGTYKTVLKNRFTETDFLFYIPESKIYSRAQHPL